MRNKKTGSCIFFTRSIFKTWNKMKTRVYFSFSFALFGDPSSSVKNMEWERGIYLTNKIFWVWWKLLSTIPQMVEETAHILMEKNFLYRAFPNLI